MSVHSLYAGFDPTASSLHIGNLIPILALIHSATLGGNPIALVFKASFQDAYPLFL
jgi:tyrosyl-tRNA synthetase